MTVPTVALESVLADMRPGFATGDNLAEGIFQIRMNNLSSEGDLLLDERRRVSPDHKKVAETLLEPGDVLFNATNSPDLVGKTAFFPGCGEPTVFSNHFLRLRTREHHLDSKYLAQWLQHEFGRGYFRAKCKQWVNQATFGQDRLAEMRVPLPPIEEQRRIASVLDAADALRARRREALAKLDVLTQAIFIDLFGDPVQNEHGWRTAPLGDVAQFVRGITFKPVDVVDAGEPGSVVCLRTKNVQAEVDLDDLFAVAPTFVKRRDQYLQAGDILISSANSWNLVGKCCWIPELPWPASFGGFVTVLRPTTESIQRRYLFEWLRHRRTQQLLRSFGRKTTNISNLNLDRCRSMIFPLPPADLQRQFVDAVKRIRHHRTTLEASSLTLDSLFASLQQRAFRGEL